MQTEVSIKDIADVLGRTERALQIRAQKECWPAVSDKVRGGRQRQYVFDLLPPDIRRAVALAEADRMGLVPANAARPPATRPVAQALPERAKEIGLAKYRLVQGWRKALSAAPWGKKNEAADAFLLAYNTGRLLPAVYETVGEVKAATVRALDTKLKKNKDDFLCLCDGRGGWKKHGTTRWRQRKLAEETRQIVLKCYLTPQRPSVTLAIRAARYALEQQGIEETASDATIQRWLADYCEKNMHVVTLARDGEKAYVDHYGPYVDRDPDLLSVGDVLVSDGKVLNFTVLHPVTGRPVRMPIIIWMDWKSRFPAGFQIMPSENTIAIHAALRMAVITLGMFPKHAYIDNGKAFRARVFTKTDPDIEACAGLYPRLGIGVHFSKSYHGRSKINERLHRTMQEQMERMVPSFTGVSIEDKPAHMARNEKFHQAWHRARTAGWVPTIREASQIVSAYFGWYVQTPHDGLGGRTPLEVFEAGRGPGIDPAILHSEFLWRKAVPADRCRITLWGVDYESDALHGFRGKVLAMFDTADMEQIYLHTLDGQYIGEALPTVGLHPMARAFNDEASIARLDFEMKRQGRLKKQAKKSLLALGVDPKGTTLLDSLPYAEKVPVSRTQKKIEAAPEPAPLPDAEVKRLSTLAEEAAAECQADLCPDRPGFFASDQARYEWCFYARVRDGYRLADEDAAWMAAYENSREYIESHQERFDQLRELYSDADYAATGG